MKISMTWLFRSVVGVGHRFKFIEEAVKWRFLDQTIKEARDAFADADAAELEDLIGEAFRVTRQN
jgi:hypothetical protein